MHTYTKKKKKKYRGRKEEEEKKVLFCIKFIEAVTLHCALV